MKYLKKKKKNKDSESQHLPSCADYSTHLCQAGSHELRLEPKLTKQKTKERDFLSDLCMEDNLSPLSVNKKRNGTMETAERVKPPIAKPPSLSQVPGIHMVSNLYMPVHVLYTCSLTCLHTHTQTHTYIRMCTHTYTPRSHTPVHMHAHTIK